MRGDCTKIPPWLQARAYLGDKATNSFARPLYISFISKYVLPLNTTFDSNTESSTERLGG